MNMNRGRGFTIIEVMLFLAITGLMISGILAAVGNNVRSQNYREGVNELRSYVQGQFDRVYSLTSDRVGMTQDPCDTGALSGRGMSSCLYVGRMLHFNEPSDPSLGSSITALPVVANAKNVDGGPESGRFGNNLSTPEDALAYSLSDYRIAVWSENESFIDNYDFNWQLTGYRANSVGYEPGLNIKDSILILRSPVDGAVRSYKIPDQTSIYNSDNVPLDLTENDPNNPGTSVLNSESADDMTIICMIDTSLTFQPSSLLAVRIAGASTGPGDIEVVSDSVLYDRGEPQC